MTDGEILTTIKERVESDLADFYDKLDTALDTKGASVTISKYSALRRYAKDLLEDILRYKREQQ